MLNEKQERFVQEYVVDLNATQAAIRAGYSESTARQQGSRLLTDDDILARVKELQAGRSEETKITANYVLSTLHECAERCMQREPVMVRRGRAMVQLQDEDGRNVWQFDSRGAIGALGLLGKHLGLFVDKVDHSSGGQPIKFTLTLDNANASRKDA